MTAPSVSDGRPKGQDAQRLDRNDDSTAALAETPSHLSSNLEETQKENERLEFMLRTERRASNSMAAQLSLHQKRLQEVEDNLQRVTDHLAAWASDHADEATTETWAALHCARAALHPKGESR